MADDVLSDIGHDWNHPHNPEPHMHGSRFFDIAHSTNYMGDEGTANAILIAAAPDLLAACEALVARLGSREYTGLVPTEQYNMALSAIARAKG